MCTSSPQFLSHISALPVLALLQLQLHPVPPKQASAQLLLVRSRVVNFPPNSITVSTESPPSSFATSTPASTRTSQPTKLSSTTSVASTSNITSISSFSGQMPGPTAGVSSTTATSTLAGFTGQTSLEAPVVAASLSRSALDGIVIGVIAIAMALTATVAVWIIRGRRKKHTENGENSSLFDDHALIPYSQPRTPGNVAPRKRHHLLAEEAKTRPSSDMDSREPTESQQLYSAPAIETTKDSHGLDTGASDASEAPFNTNELGESQQIRRPTSGGPNVESVATSEPEIVQHFDAGPLTEQPRRRNRIDLPPQYQSGWGTSY